jgi:hypothetical protein
VPVRNKLLRKKLVEKMKEWLETRGEHDFLLAELAKQVDYSRLSVAKELGWTEFFQDYGIQVERSHKTKFGVMYTLKKYVEPNTAISAKSEGISA